MKTGPIEIVRHPDETRLGEALVRLDGVRALPTGATFRVGPLDDDELSSTLQFGWPQGDLAPRDVSVDERGLTFVIGPEVVDAPALQPGVPVRLVIASAGLMRELLWPYLPTARTAPRQAVIVDPQAAVKAHAASVSAGEVASPAGGADAEPGVMPELAAAEQEDQAADLAVSAGGQTAGAREVAAATSAPSLSPPSTSSTARGAALTGSSGKGKPVGSSSNVLPLSGRARLPKAEQARVVVGAKPGVAPRGDQAPRPEGLASLPKANGRVVGRRVAPPSRALNGAARGEEAPVVDKAASAPPVVPTVDDLKTAHEAGDETPSQPMDVTTAFEAPQGGTPQQPASAGAVGEGTAGETTLDAAATARLDALLSLQPLNNRSGSPDGAGVGASTDAGAPRAGEGKVAVATPAAPLGEAGAPGMIPPLPPAAAALIPPPATTSPASAPVVGAQASAPSAAEQTYYVRQDMLESAPLPRIAQPEAIAQEAARQRARGRYRARVGFAIGVAAALVAAVGIGWFSLNRPDLMQRFTKAAGFEPTVAKIEPPRLLDLLDIPSRSPLGLISTGTPLDDALLKADNQLTQTGARAKAEAKYWLRYALAKGLSDRRMPWALTQLGTLYAQPVDGEHDYATARLLWELAGSRGDPVALCFLARLHEHGLGTRQDRGRALSLLERAKAQGGCQGIDRSIARLKGL
ncbi:MAG: hypothetical protein AAFR04_00055 [Pseudomonadota bacterium]